MEISTKTQDDPSNLDQLVEELRKIVTDTGLPCRTDAFYLIRSLRSTHFVVKDALKQLKSFQNFRKSYPEIFTGWERDLLLESFKGDMGSLLKDRAPDGAVIFYSKMGNWDPSLYNVDDMFKLCVWGGLVTSEEEDIQRAGVHVIYDYDGLAFHHVRNVSLRSMKMQMHFMQDCFPVFIKSVHFINQGAIANALLTMIAQFASEKIKKMTHLHGKDYDSLHKHFPRHILPEDAGGTNGRYKNSDFLLDKVLESADRDWDSYL